MVSHQQPEAVHPISLLPAPTCMTPPGKRAAFPSVIVREKADVGQGEEGEQIVIEGA